jgi:hypothetical protein
MKRWPGPTRAKEKPAAAGTNNLITLNAIEFSEKAFIRASLGIITANRDILAGSLITQEIPNKKTKENRFQVAAYPAIVMIE